MAFEAPRHDRYRDDRAELEDTFGLIDEAYTDTKEPTGFVNTNTDSDLTWTDGTRTFEIDPSVTSYSFWIKGRKYTISTTKSIVIPDTEGMHHIYFDTDEALHSTTTFSEDLLNEYVYVANLYWNATDNEIVVLGDERHGLEPWQSHLWTHRYQGTKVRSGLAIADIDADQSGALDVHAECSVASGSVDDEDVNHAVSALTLPAQIPVMYRTGAAGEWRKATATNAPILTTGTGRMAWNEIALGAWAQTEHATIKYGLAHIFATNDPRAGHQVVSLQGQATYATKALARAGALTEINDLLLGDLPVQEIVALGTIIYQTSTSYGNTWKSRTVTTDAGEDYVDWRADNLSGGGGAGAHTHEAIETSVDAAAFAGTLSPTDTNVQAALETVDAHTHVREVPILSYRNSASEDLDGTNVAVTWGTALHTTKGTAISWSGANPTRVTINENGWYQISFNLNGTSAVARTAIAAQIRKDGSTFAGPIAGGGYIRVSTGNLSASVACGAFTLFLTATTYIEVVCNTIGAAGTWDTVIGACSITVIQVMPQ